MAKESRVVGGCLIVGGNWTSPAEETVLFHPEVGVIRPMIAQLQGINSKDRTVEPKHDPLSGIFLALMVNERAKNRLKPLVAAGQHHHVGNIDGRSTGMPTTD